jgi:hypothetical protein
MYEVTPTPVYGVDALLHEDLLNECLSLLELVSISYVPGPGNVTLSSLIGVL